MDDHRYLSKDRSEESKGLLSGESQPEEARMLL